MRGLAGEQRGEKGGEGGKAVNSHPRIRCEHLIFAPVVSFIDSSHVGACKIFKNASSHFLLLSLSTLPLRTDLVRFGAGEGRAALPPDPPLPAEDALPGLTAAQVALPPPLGT